jgi:hypothetical protein
MRSAIVLAALAALSLTPQVAGAAAAKAGAQSVAATRAAFGGSWNRYPDIDMPLTPGVPAAPPIPPPPLKAPYKAQWEATQKKQAEMVKAGQPIFNNYAQCIGDGMPAMMQGMFPMEILQTPGQITIIQEAYNQVRRVKMNQKQSAVEDTEPTFAGHAVGHWEGDTLVLETIGVKERVRYRETPHSDQMKIVERLKLIRPNILQNEVTVTDPVYLEAPWKWTWLYIKKPGYTLYEYVCEDNRQFQDPETGGTRLKVTAR